MRVCDEEKRQGQIKDSKVTMQGVRCEHDPPDRQLRQTAEGVLKWLMGKGSLKEQGCSKATFERRAQRFWGMRPLPETTGEMHDALFVDGICISRKLGVLIAATKEHVVSWHLAENECSASWAADIAEDEWRQWD